MNLRWDYDLIHLCMLFAVQYNQKSWKSSKQKVTCICIFYSRMHFPHCCVCLVCLLPSVWIVFLLFFLYKISRLYELLGVQARSHPHRGTREQRGGANWPPLDFCCVMRSTCTIWLVVVLLGACDFIQAGRLKSWILPPNWKNENCWTKKFWW